MDGSPLFDWDDSNTEHLARHDVSREEAEAFFNFPRHEEEQLVKDEPRIWALGKTLNGRYLALIYTIRNGRIRPITAHTAKRKDRNFYEQIFGKEGRG